MSSISLLPARARRPVFAAALLLACATFGLAGGYLAVRAFANTVEPFVLGTLDVTVLPSRQGRVEVYVPIVDWGVRVTPFKAPVGIELQFRSLDRDRALATLRDGADAGERLDAIRSELARMIRRAVLTAAWLGTAGGVAGGLLGGGLIGAALHRRRWLAYGAAAGLAAPILFLGLVVGALRSIDYEAFQRPTFYAHGREMPRLLELSEQILGAQQRYTESYEQALAGLTNLIAYAGGLRPPAVPTTSVVLASDIHSNSLVLPVLEAYTQGKTVFLAGDHTLLGAGVESGLAWQLARLGERVVAVSGNHDSRPFMVELARAGVMVLTRGGRLLPDGSIQGPAVVDVAGLRVAGYDDPLEGDTDLVQARPLDYADEAQFASWAEKFVAWFEGLPERPDAVLVHQRRLGRSLLRALGEAPGEPLLLLTGHTHQQAVEQRGSVLLVDGGTAGAGGPFAIGVQPVGFAVVHLDQIWTPQAVDLIEVEPLSGNAQAQRRTIENLADRDGLARSEEPSERADTG